MKRDLVLSGIAGLILGLIVFLAANCVKNYIPFLAPSFLATLIVFAILILIAFLEMPMMVFALRKMAQSATMPRGVIVGVFLFYVAFAAVYASMHVLLTGDNYFYFGTLLAALGLVRLASGMWIG